MNPIWAVVELTRAPFTSGFTSMTAAPYTMVAAPATTVSVRAASSEAIGASLTSRMPPALTRPACSSAETGVGAANVAGSHRWKGIWADLDRAATTTRTATTGKAGPPSCPGCRSRRFTGPHTIVASPTAAHSAPSPMAKATRVRLNPSRADGSCPYMASSKHSARPATDQQAAMATSEFAVMSPAEAPVSRLAPAVNQCARGSPAR